MKMRPLVSVLMPVRNVAPFISQALHSVCSQPLQEMEVVVVDDGSTDETLDTAASFPDDRIRVFSQEGPRGVAAARNRCVSLARGRLFAWMDGDDLSVPDRLLTQATFLHRNPSVDVVGGDVVPLNSENRYGMPWNPPSSPLVIKWGFLFGTPLVNGTVMARREVYQRGRGYDEDLRVAEDYEFWLRGSNELKMTNLRRIVLLYRRHPTNTTLIEASASVDSSALLSAAALSVLLAEEVSPELSLILRDPRRMQRKDVEDGLPGRAMRVMDLAANRFDSESLVNRRDGWALARTRSMQRTALAASVFRRNRSAAMDDPMIRQVFAPSQVALASVSYVFGRLRIRTRRLIFLARVRRWFPSPFD